MPSSKGFKKKQDEGSRESPSKVLVPVGGLREVAGKKETLSSNPSRAPLSVGSGFNAVGECNRGTTGGRT